MRGHVRPLKAVYFTYVLIAASAAPAAEIIQIPERGDQLNAAYFRAETKRLADACLKDYRTRAEWEKARPELRRQFLEMIGLWPLPPRSDLKPVITGKVDGGKFTIEKLHFQSLPGLYVTGNLYIPKDAVFPAPTVLYVCGHGNTVVDGISYGSKVSYQHHPAWLAEHGYVCLILDTLQLGEIQGLHHGTYRLSMWWWQTLGYTPAGIECWNGMRALDYLETRKEVDPKRFAVTGRSGGGATSWWVAAADDRPQCIIPVAGIADLWAQVVEGVAPRLKKGVINGHCDCMFMVNTYRWDFPMVAALCAPRPLLLGNSDVDDIFPVPGYRRLADKVRRIYDLYDARDRFALLETKGPHKDTPELRQGAFAWLNRWLKNETNPITGDRDDKRFTPQQLKVYPKQPPEDALNVAIQEVFIQPARPTLPRQADVVKVWWPAQAEEWRQALQDKVFRGWPQEPPPLSPKAGADITRAGLRVRGIDFTSQEGVDLRCWLVTAEKVEKPSLVVLTTVDETGWQDWLKEIGPDFKEALQLAELPKVDEKKAAALRQLLSKQKWGFVTVAPRGIGPTRWSEVGTLVDNQIKRRYALLGQTLDGQRVWDVRRALAAVSAQPDLEDVPVWLQGHGEMAVIALYAALFEPKVKRLDLWQPPHSHRDGPTFLNVRRIFDIPQAMALAFPCEIRLYVNSAAEEAAWEWPMRLQQALGRDFVKVRRPANQKAASNVP